jgi:hypothetical protein
MVGILPQLSVEVAVPVISGEVPSAFVTVIFGGHIISGGMISFTVITCVHEAELPHSSVAL